MPRIYYEITATILDQGIVDDWVRWMLSEHMDKVLTGGAESARLLRLDESPNIFLVQYDFPSRQHYERYQATHAPQLRAEGARRFESEQVRYTRRAGEYLR